ncbi:MAG: hypothetical protein OEU68_16615 [Nitrospira sp.]|nr:hypothetical protein [Nitrospira sp.]MDH4245807.1 hypothetical protein [Nitrospira sp.]MDH4357992.1 hypothetical protein [Nitrospira sp.]MDH5320252.1 hypothetical protein [Nitrospira sp.]
MHIKSIQAEDFEVGKDVSSKHWANLYTRKVKHINQENIKQFAQMENEDPCGEILIRKPLEGGMNAVPLRLPIDDGDWALCPLGSAAEETECWVGEPVAAILRTSGE